ncbi:hypothetical protein BD311DRAFT_766430 [Dichomitus squalens]|uniref:DUF7727 domain-containing protein n=1 Tax=Dichomitus squalens TaxID=114155 RepID=A0A4V2K8X0_9APHY|nr:hypothetical protein BD311DRAFT_766430 [Dichomitus squalens]TBU61588.1 hypothetical protein BD310DRAFT_812764 [Dichomitus squalens]
MGNLIWHEYARYVALTSVAYSMWAAFWGILYRKYFFDFVHGIVRSPGGVQPAASDSIFITVIVKAPIVQILSMLLAFGYLALDYPAPFLKGSVIHRSFPIRIILLFLQTFLSILYYQGTNAALYSFIAAMCYVRAQVKGEMMADAKDNKGRGGGKA